MPWLWIHFSIIIKFSYPLRCILYRLLPISEIMLCRILFVGKDALIKYFSAFNVRHRILLPTLLNSILEQQRINLLSNALDVSTLLSGFEILLLVILSMDYEVIPGFLGHYTI